MSPDPRNKRLRASILVEQNETRILVDTPPDLRQQLLGVNLRRLDAVVYTHCHADHVHGIDELRCFNYLMDRPVEVYGDNLTLAGLRQRFGYVFDSKGKLKDNYWYAPKLNTTVINGPFRISDMEIQPFQQSHGEHRDPTLGFRFGPVAYSTDAKDISEEGFELLAGVRVWVVDCQRENPNTAHSHVKQTLDWIDRVRPERAILTHMEIIRSTTGSLRRGHCPMASSPHMTAW